MLYVLYNRLFNEKNTLCPQTIQNNASYIGYEPADLTVHPPPRTAEGGFIFFV